MVTRAYLESREEIELGLVLAVNGGYIFNRDKFSPSSQRKWREKF